MNQSFSLPICKSIRKDGTYQNYVKNTDTTICKERTRDNTKADYGHYLEKLYDRA
jgi:hypothetical protein